MTPSIPLLPPLAVGDVVCAKEKAEKQLNTAKLAINLLMCALTFQPLNSSTT
jgi:hypothetical protein